MKAEEIRIGNWVLSPVGNPYTVVELHRDYAHLDNSIGRLSDILPTIGVRYDALDPIPLTPELLLKNGWRKQTELTYYKKLDKIRLGWQEGGVLIVGWTEWPKKIESVHQLQNILADLGYEEQANNFKI